jgi:hypothetical protein
MIRTSRKQHNVSCAWNCGRYASRKKITCDECDEAREKEANETRADEEMAKTEAKTNSTKLGG